MKNIVTIDENAFANCQKLSSATIYGNVSCIGNLAFSDCINLVSLSICNGVQEIGPSAFNGCSSLMDVSIPSTVVSVGEYVFTACDGISNVTFIGKTTSEIQQMDNINQFGVLSNFIRGEFEDIHGIYLKLENGQSIGVDSDEVTQGTIGSYRNEITRAIIGDDIENDYN